MSTGHDVQRACYIAIRRKGWLVEVGIMSVWAHHPQRDVRIYAKDFRELVTKVSKQEAEWNNSHARREH